MYANDKELFRVVKTQIECIQLQRILEEWWDNKVKDGILIYVK